MAQRRCAAKIQVVPVALICGGSSNPCVGTDVLIAQGSFTIPNDHSGVVLIVAKSDVQGGSCDKGGAVKLIIKLDGVQRGSTGVQELLCPNGESHRTLTASYLATGLARGSSHTVAVYGRAELVFPNGSFEGVSMTNYLPLIWFD